jgi:hypothetical protein
MTTQLIEILLYSLILSLYINALHIMFQKEMFLYPLYLVLEVIFRQPFIKSKWRNDSGLLYIAKPIYACASCMPSIHSLPLLLILPLWKVAIIAVISVTIATLINDKIFE